MTAVADPSNFNRAKEQSLENQAQLFQQLQSFPHIYSKLKF